MHSATRDGGDGEVQGREKGKGWGMGGSGEGEREGVGDGRFRGGGKGRGGGWEVQGRERGRSPSTTLTLRSSICSEETSVSLEMIPLSVSEQRGSSRALQTWKDWLAYWWEEQVIAHCGWENRLHVGG